MPILVMIGTNIESVKAYVTDQLEVRGLYDMWVATVLDRIQKNTRLNIYCSKCRELGYLQFSTWDDNWVCECENCGFLFRNLDTELLDIMHYNATMHKRDMINLKRLE